ncbi:hypothetical protein QBC45DRAFT_404528 [Copromyces sp. CBS 386.78]|nr:hypothetical protein QBC45DRAFT_404528 [Copromyces sp. CBS 386.78]
MVGLCHCLSSELPLPLTPSTVPRMRLIRGFEPPAQENQEHQDLRLSKQIPRQPRKGSKGVQDSKRRPKKTTKSPWQSKKRVQEFSKNTKKYHELPRITKNYQELPRITKRAKRTKKDVPKIPRDSRASCTEAEPCLALSVNKPKGSKGVCGKHDDGNGNGRMKKTSGFSVLSRFESAFYKRSMKRRKHVEWLLPFSWWVDYGIMFICHLLSKVQEGYGTSSFRSYQERRREEHEI